MGFALTGGASRKGHSRKRDFYDLFPDEPIYEDIDLTLNGLTVLKKVKDTVMDYVYRERPWKISFYATTQRKTPIYRWMAVRIAKTLPQYNLVEAPEGTFSFYKLVTRVA